MIGCVLIHWFKLTCMKSMYPETDWNDHDVVINAGVYPRQYSKEGSLWNFYDKHCSDLHQLLLHLIWLFYFMIHNNCCVDVLLVYPFAIILLLGIYPLTVMSLVGRGPKLEHYADADKMREILPLIGWLLLLYLVCVLCQSA